MKKVFVFIILFLLFIPTTVFGYVQKSAYKYVTDDGNLLSEDTINYITTYSSFLKKQKGIDYYVVTVQNLESSNLNDYSNWVYDSFNISSKGLLIFVTKDERMIRVIVGEELSDVVGNDVIDRYIKSYFMPYFKTEEWNKGIKNGYSAFYKMLCNYYNIDSRAMDVYAGPSFLKKYKTLLMFIVIWIGTTLMYVFCMFFKKIYIYRNVTFIDYFIFWMSLFINILLLIFAYSIDLSSLLLALVVELVGVFSSFLPSSNDGSNNRKSTKRIKKRKSIRLF